MIININLTDNKIIYYYDIKKDKLTEEYITCAYRNFSTKDQNLFPILKDIIATKKEVDAEFFTTKLNKVFKRELMHTRSFGQTAKQIVSFMNSHKNTTENLKQPLVLSVLYLNGKPLPKVEKMCLIDNNIYFITKYKKKYIMHAVNDENMKCVIPLSNIFNLYKKLKKVDRIKKSIKRKPKTRPGQSLPSSRFMNIDSCAFQIEEITEPRTIRTESQTGRIRLPTNSRNSRQLIYNSPLRSRYRTETIPIVPEWSGSTEQDGEEVREEGVEQILERNSRPESVEQPACAPLHSYDFYSPTLSPATNTHRDGLEEQVEIPYNNLLPADPPTNSNDDDSDEVEPFQTMYENVTLNDSN